MSARLVGSRISVGVDGVGSDAGGLSCFASLAGSTGAIEVVGAASEPPGGLASLISALHLQRETLPDISFELIEFVFIHAARFSCNGD